MAAGLDFPRMPSQRTVLAFDFGSPVASVAVARDGELAAERSADRDGGDRDLLRLVDETLRGAGAARCDLDGVIALRGPGSFTGTRVACATALGLAAGLDIMATGVSTLEGLALSAGPDRGEVLAVVDALRGEWFVQRFAGPSELVVKALDSPRIERPGSSTLGGVRRLVGFGAARFATAAGLDPEWAFEPREVASAVARAASLDRWPWDRGLLSLPLYLRPPATSRPR